MPNYMQFCAISLEVLLKTARISVVLFVCVFIFDELQASVSSEI